VLQQCNCSNCINAKPQKAKTPRRKGLQRLGELQLQLQLPDAKVQSGRKAAKVF
jgi:hypothetical protein